MQCVIAKNKMLQRVPPTPSIIMVFGHVWSARVITGGCAGNLWVECTTVHKHKSETAPTQCPRDLVAARIHPILQHVIVFLREASFNSAQSPHNECIYRVLFEDSNIKLLSGTSQDKSGLKWLLCLTNWLNIYIYTKVLALERVPLWNLVII